jgi:hypothetical protein
MKKAKLAVILFAATLLSSCTENEIAKNYGGTVNLKVPNNCVVITATWKESNLWVLYKDTTNNKVFLIEDSQFGMWNGRVNFE